MQLEVLKKLELATDRRAAIVQLERAIVQGGHDVGPASCPVRHFFAPGEYTREITMPEGLVVVGKIHKHAHSNALIRGRVQVFTEGGGLEEFQAPRTWVSEPYTKRVVLVMEDAVWFTTHKTDKTDLAEIEAEIIAPDFTEVPT